jgi:hypothetical protein
MQRFFLGGESKSRGRMTFQTLIKNRRNNMVLIIVGGVLILFGLVDLIGSFTGFDLWGEWIGVDLPEIIWRFSAWIEIGIGWVLIQIGSAKHESHESDE